MAHPVSKKKTFDLELFAKYKAAHTAGDVKKADYYRNLIIVDNMKLVYRMSNRYFRSSSLPCGQEDLEQAGMIGMAKCLPTFDPSKGRFSTYAVHYIRQEILLAVEGHMLLKRPSGASVPYKVWRAQEAFYAKHGREAEAADLGVTEKQMAGWKGKLVFLSLESPKSIAGTHEYRLGAFVNARDNLENQLGDAAPSAEDIMVEDATKNEALAAFSRLHGVQRAVIYETVVRGRQDNIVAKELKLSIGEVADIRADALAKMRKEIEDEEA